MFNKKKITALIITVFLTINLCSCGQDIPQNNTENPSAPITLPTKVYTNKTSPENSNDEQPEKIDTTAHIVCAGDNLIHNYIYEQAAEHSTVEGGYDFSSVYEHVIDYIKVADLAVLNQETIITDEFSPSTYPNFCSPEVLGDYMVDVVGFDAMSLANNHILDKREKGLLATLRYWDTKHPDIIRYGAYRDTDDMNHIRTKEINDITFAFLGYMDHTNGIPHDATKGGKIVKLEEIETIEEQIKQAKEIADVVIVSPHYGVEVSNEVTKQQKDLTQDFINWGADIVVGTQPHTLQPCEWITRDDGTQGFVYYCLGNFVSAMSSSPGMVGGLADLTVRKNYETGEITIENPKIIPLVSHYEKGYKNVTVYPYAEYTDELASVHGMRPENYENGIFSMELVKSIVALVPEEFLLIK